MPYKLTESADKGFNRLYTYGIETFGERQADNYVSGLIDRFNQLTVKPYHWKPVDDIRPGYRLGVYGSHSIYYRIESSDIIIIPILGREDPNNQLSQYTYE